jgi:long-chain-fatty-acid--[acyl-carrier-protein] ligase
LGYLTPAGALVISGRLKRFVKIGGEMVSLGAIEDILIHTIGKEQQVENEGPLLAISFKEEAGEKTKIVLFTSFPVSLEEANQKLREAGFSNLIKIHVCKELEEIPLMGTGKINYRALESLLPSLLEENMVQDNHLNTK